MSLTITSVCTPYRFAKCMDELAFILQVMADMRGLDKFFEQTFAGSTFGCIYCWLRGYQRANKMVYSGHHVYLPPCHHLRPRIARHNQASEMPERAADSTLQPSPRTNEELRNGMLVGILGGQIYICAGHDACCFTCGKSCTRVVLHMSYSTGTGSWTCGGYANHW